MTYVFSPLRRSFVTIMGKRAPLAGLLILLSRAYLLKRGKTETFDLRLVTVGLCIETDDLPSVTSDL